MYRPGGGAGLGELMAAPVHPAVPEQVTSVAFSPAEEVMWAGTEGGGLYQLQCPGLERHSSVCAHQQPVHSLRPVAHHVASLSGDRVRVHATGGLPRMTFMHAEAGPFAAMEVHPQSSARVVVACQAGGLLDLDLATRSIVAQAQMPEDILVLGGPASKGLLVVGSSDGRIHFTDPRADFKVQHTVTAHPGGLEAVDVRGEFVATCGYGVRMGQVVPDTTVKVFDLRAAPRMVGSVPFRPGPTLLQFHPKFSSTLLVGSAAGVFTLADIQGVSYASTYQIDTQGDAVTSCHMSSTGELTAFGGSGGYVHLWAGSPEARVNTFAQPVELPTDPKLPPSTYLREEDSFALMLPYHNQQVKLLSDFDATEPMSMGLPPRIIPPELLASMRQSDFMGYIQNPHSKRGGKRGEAAAAVAGLRNTRVQPKLSQRGDESAQRAERVRQREAAGGQALPEQYLLQHVTVQTQHKPGVRFAEGWDLGLYNKTRFAGLENGIANCYANPLVQVMFFTPDMRDAMLGTMPDPNQEFSLTDEMSLLFRMLVNARGAVCQASNLFRALRQNAEAAALGLLEGHKQREGDADLEVEVRKDQSLRRRVQALQRFLLEQLHKEAAQQLGLASPSPAAVKPLQATDAAQAPAAAARQDADRHAELAVHLQLSAGGDGRVAVSLHPVRAPAPATGSSSAPASPPAAAARQRATPDGAKPVLAAQGVSTVVDGTFGLLMSQQTQCLVGERPQKMRESWSFQVELHYPPAKQRPHAVQPDRSPPAVAPAEQSPQPLLAAAAPSAGSPAAGRPQQPQTSPAAQQHAQRQQLQRGQRAAFGDVLAQSLALVSEMRAWFDDSVGYQPLRQSRVPLSLSRVLVVSTGLTDDRDLAWWQPYAPEGPDAAPEPWLPWAVCIDVDTRGRTVAVKEAASAAELLRDDAQEQQPGHVRAVYELTAVIAHVHDADAGQGPEAQEGHLLAHVRVLPEYLDPEAGIAQSPAAPSPSQSPLAAAEQQPFGAAPSAYSSALHRAASLSAARAGGAPGAGSLPPGPAQAAAALRQQAAAGSRGPAETAEGAEPDSLLAAAGDRAPEEPAVDSAGAGRQQGPHASPQQQAQAAGEAAGQDSAAATVGQGHAEAAAGQTQQQTPATLAATGAMDAQPQEVQQHSGQEPEVVAHAGESHAMAGETASAEERAGMAASVGLAVRHDDSSAGLQDGLAVPSTAPQAAAGQPNRAGRDGAVEAVAPDRAASDTAGPSSLLDNEAVAAATAAAEAASMEAATLRGVAGQAAAIPELENGLDAPEGMLSQSDEEVMMEEADHQPAATPAAAVLQAADLARPLSRLQLRPMRTDSSSAAGVPDLWQEPCWLLMNDFAITRTEPEEVREMYGAQKVPCLLYFTRVGGAEAGGRRASPQPAPQPAPVLSPEAFLELCAAPPLQGAAALAAPSFEPLGHDEAPHPGMTFGLDAEFVALSHPRKILRDGVEVEVRKPRMGLARVSVVRGSGPRAGVPAIDDYIRSLEPVADYLTKFSGLVPGDLDPVQSRHHLTTLKRAYLKLRYLVDAGCVFVGHDLRHDFKLLNIIVPAAQTVDTVYLFHFKRQRKLSLRYLGAYLLGIDIQQRTHDSIEDAYTALQLYQVYLHLKQAGRFQEKLLELYRHGKAHGWDPAAARDAKQQVIVS